MFQNRVIFESENDFSLCLKQSFPRLKTTKLRRKQWCILRSLIGKPRRCSDAFFREERLMLEEKRQKIRLIQQRKVNEKELIDFKDLPQEIPLTLSIGHRVYSHISYPEEGVFLGTIAAIDPCDHTYRVVFDRATIGSQTVNDYEIKSLTPIQTIPIKAYLQTYRPKLTPNTNTLTNNSSSSLAMLTPHKSVVSSLLTPNNGMLGGFPIRLLVMITRLNKILNVKREYITKLSGLNTEAEKLRANNETITKEFQKNYAILVLDLEKLNKDLSDYLTGVQRYCEELMAPGEFNKLLLANTTNTTNKLIQRQNSAEIIFDSHLKFEDLKKNLLNESISLVNKLNIKSIDQLETNMNSINLNDNNSTVITSDNDKKIKSKNLIQLIIKLTNLLFQIREYTNATHRGSSSNNNQQQQSSTFLPNCTRLINDSINEIKTSLSSESKINLFVDKVQVHINHIQSTLCHYNKLNAFKLNSDNNSETLINDSFTDEYEDYEQTNQFNEEDEEDEEEENEENEEENQHLNESDSDNSYKTSNSNENLLKYFTNNNKHKLKTVSKSKLKRKRLDNSNKNINSSNNNNTKEKTHLVNYQQVLLSSPSSSSSSSSSSFHSSKTVNASLNSSNSSKNNTNNNNSSKKLHIGIST